MARQRRTEFWRGGPRPVDPRSPNTAPPLPSYCAGRGWSVLRGRELLAGGFDTRDEAQAWIDGQ